MSRFFFSLFLALLISEFSFAQRVLNPEEIADLLPKKVKGFYDDGDSKSSLMKLGDIRYSLSERKFSKGKQKIKFLLFDYKEASIMYKQAMRKWNNELVDSDTLIFKNITMTNCTGWESYNKRSESSQIFLGICNRFFLMISGEYVSLDQLEETANLFDFATFPK